MPIKTKRWNDPREPDDGYRILITRYRPRGLPKGQETWDAWIPGLGPSRELLADPDAPQWPMLVEGFGVFYYENIQIPTYHQVRNQPGVTLPIWFVSGDDMLKAWEDGYVTYKELKDAPSRFTGTRP